MADILLNIFIEGLFTKAFSLANEELSLIWGVKENLESLARNLEMIQALLVDADQRNKSSGAVEIWLRRLQNVASKADNVLDEFGYEVLGKKIWQQNHDKVRCSFSCSNPFVFRFRMAHKIRNINLSIEKVFQDANRIGLRPVQIPTCFPNPTSERLNTDPFVDQSEVIGRTESLVEMVRILTFSEGEKNLSLVGIVGMPGIGKTTVAQLVYKNKEVERHFDHKIWIHVSDNFNVERLLNDMVQSLMGTVSELTLKEAIVRKLQNELNAKRFLLVLDDVWNEDEELWNSMRKCLVEIGASTGSRILVTTRKERVVLTMEASFICHLGILSEDHSWELFEKIAFGPGGPVKSSELMNIGREIVKKCGGVPLAIKAIGCLMHSRKEEREWSKIEKSDVWNAFSTNGNRVKSAIKLSYDHLPSLSLKQCFAFCSLYGKGTVMESDSMIQIWMAKGLLNSSKENQVAMEDIGSGYINILLQSSLLECTKRDEYGNTTHYKMHDLVHDFAFEIAKDCSLFIIDEPATGKKEVARKKLNQIFSGNQALILSGGLENKLRHCEDLRILIVIEDGRTELPKVIGKLKHLRYLDITQTSIAELPNHVAKLYNLQTLRLGNLRELPKNFHHLASLRHLYMQERRSGNEQNCLLPGIGKLTCLQTLPFFRVSQDGQCKIEELGHLNTLKGNLEICGLQNVKNLEEASKAKISAKMNLESLELQWDLESSNNASNDEDVLKGLEPHSNLKGLTIENFEGQSLPPWMLSTCRPVILRNLVKIIFKNLHRCENLPPLGHLMHLKIVNVVGMNSVKSIGSDFYGWGNRSYPIVIFPALEELSLKDLPNLMEWSGVSSSKQPVEEILPSLVKLSIENCRNLVSLPDDIWKNLTSIKEFWIWECQSLSRLPEGVGKLESLEILSIRFSDNLERIPDISSLKCLRQLHITFCTCLHSLPSGLEACTSIDDLIVIGCRKLQQEDLHGLPTRRLRFFGIGDFCQDLDYFPWPFHTNANNLKEDLEFQQPFASLEVLLLFGWKKLRSLPEQIQHLSTLNFLTIARFDGQYLPEWLGNMCFLRTLSIGLCDKLLYFPSAEAMRRLINLKTLAIEDCPLLEERCKKESGPEWPKIAHIPTIEINRLAIPH